VSQPRFFVSRACEPGEEVALDPADVRHAAVVLRLREGDRVTLAAEGSLWSAELTAIGRDAASARVLQAAGERSCELPIDVAILQALPKGLKFDVVVEKCVELGARRIIPVICARSLSAANRPKIERWRRIARAAAQQSRRLWIPMVEDATPWEQAVARHAGLLVAFEGAPARSLAAALKRRQAERAFAIAVGPEGSFTPEELAAAKDAGADLVSLGPSILRTETAAAALLAALASRYW